ncbi:amino acid/amide ABC transporter membrane protein 2, HAAT family (TC 3.A.1.4.-) [Geosporobacter subterraneus DSM 17957]|uniref:Amino acid/amide ABC transporter membrane protein 2, HAAT family (TC 3.A.1.4.-) n=2 Tax=Geosporobacter TaxID=390805 RepID=A0A1M6PK00_9FIRM|nr:amino acid/amide ABC transporter membrane protein 2, HAAT family (TC 3.A.1.4.-) [Geosporobacter subterraneus DSM 17957]
MRAMDKNRLIVAAGAVALGIILQLLIWNGTLNAYYAQVLTMMSIFVIMATSLNLINGITGQFSLGHAGFAAVGGYFSAIITTRLQLPLPAPMIFTISLLVGGLIAALAGFLIGLPTLRLKGDYLAIATLGFGEIIRVLFLNWKYVGAAAGMWGIPGYTNFIWAYMLAVLTVIFIVHFMNSSHGRACISIREDEIAAETMGINTTKYKVMAFTFGAFFAGVGGAVLGHLIRLLHPATFSMTFSVEILLMVVLGGLGSITGSISAAILLTFVSEALRKFNELRMVIYALMLIGIMLFRPQGLFGRKEFSLDLLTDSRFMFKSSKNRGA